MMMMMIVVHVTEFNFLLHLQGSDTEKPAFLLGRGFVVLKTEYQLLFETVKAWMLKRVGLDTFYDNDQMALGESVLKEHIWNIAVRDLWPGKTWRVFVAPRGNRKGRVRTMIGFHKARWDLLNCMYNLYIIYCV